MSPETFFPTWLPSPIIVLIAAVLPIFELRLAVPLGINVFGLPWYFVLVLAIIGNILPVPFILLFLDLAVKIAKHFPVLDRFSGRLFERTRYKAKVVKKYKTIGLVLFVGIPLPFTGAWTGAITAVLLGLSFWRAFISILVGVLIAGVIVTVLSLMGWLGAIIAGLVLSILTVIGLWKE